MLEMLDNGGCGQASGRGWLKIFARGLVTFTQEPPFLRS